VLEFFTDEMADMYWAENYLLKALPKMQRAATSVKLKDAFGKHMQQTREHISPVWKRFLNCCI